MKLEDKLLSLRKQQGLTQLELAEALHISRQAISKWETGEAEPSLENLKSLSQIYHISLDELLGEGKLPEPKAPPEDQPPVQPPQEEPKEETNGGESLASQATSANQRILPFVALGVVAALLLGLVAFLWWWNLPAQQFSYWSEEPSGHPDQNGVDLFMEVTRNADGSGYIDYTLTNNTQLVKSCSKVRWVDYYYQGEYHGISESQVLPLSAMSSLYVLEPGEYVSEVVVFPAGTFNRPGRYRFCSKDVGDIEFAVFEDGYVLVGSGASWMGGTM